MSLNLLCSCIFLALSLSSHSPPVQPLSPAHCPSLHSPQSLCSFSGAQSKGSFLAPQAVCQSSGPAFLWSPRAEDVSGHPRKASRQGFILIKSALCHPQRSTASPRLIFAIKTGKNSFSINAAMQAGVPTAGQLWKRMWISDCIN